MPKPKTTRAAAAKAALKITETSPSAVEPPPAPGAWVDPLKKPKKKPGPKPGFKTRSKEEIAAAEAQRAKEKAAKQLADATPDFEPVAQPEAPGPGRSAPYVSPQLLRGKPMYKPTWRKPIAKPGTINKHKPRAPRPGQVARKRHATKDAAKEAMRLSAIKSYNAPEGPARRRLNNLLNRTLAPMNGYTDGEAARGWDAWTKEHVRKHFEDAFPTGVPGPPENHDVRYARYREIWNEITGTPATAAPAATPATAASAATPLTEMFPEMPTAVPRGPDA